MDKNTRLQPWQWMLGWLTREDHPHEVPLCDFDRLSDELRPGDVLLIEGRTRIGGVIKVLTQSPWTHAALYIGRLHDIHDKRLRQLVIQSHQQDYGEQLLIEAVIGEGTRVSPLTRYRDEHLRICRPYGLAPGDAQRVCGYAIRRLGDDYDVRQLLDLARFLMPLAILPRRWRSSLFAVAAGTTSRAVCSCLLAEAYASVHFPILPFVERQEGGEIRLFHRNPRLFTPRDFDYSPYFDVIKYPVFGIEDVGRYRELPWCESDAIYSDRNRFYRAALTSALANLPPAQDRAPLSETADSAAHDALSTSGRFGSWARALVQALPPLARRPSPSPAVAGIEAGSSTEEA